MRRRIQVHLPAKVSKNGYGKWTRVSRTLELDLILNYEGLALVIYSLVELGGNGVMSCGVLDHKTFVFFNSLENGRLLNGPGPNIGPVFRSLRVFLLCM